MSVSLPATSRVDDGWPGGVARQGCDLHERRRSAMRMHLALLFAAVIAVSPLVGVAGEKQIVDVKELAGSWRGWVTAEAGQGRATMNIQAAGRYKAAPTRGSTAQGKFYPQEGKLRYRSSRSNRTRKLSHDQVTTTPP